jgi:predicted membrane protein
MTRIVIGAIVILMGLSALIGFSLFRFALAAVLIFIGVNIIMGKRHNGAARRIGNQGRQVSEVACSAK